MAGQIYLVIVGRDESHPAIAQRHCQAFHPLRYPNNVNPSRLDYLLLDAVCIIIYLLRTRKMVRHAATQTTNPCTCPDAPAMPCKQTESQLVPSQLMSRLNVDARLDATVPPSHSLTVRIVEFLGSWHEKMLT